MAADEMENLYKADFAIYSIYADIDTKGGLAKIKSYYGGKTGNFYTNQKNWRQGFRPWRALVDLRTMKIVLAEGMSQSSGVKQYPMEKMIEACNNLPD